MEHLEWGLQEAGGRGSLIVTDGVFSMDGDIALLEEIVELAARYDARVMVDDAHGAGRGRPGRARIGGRRRARGRGRRVVGTLGKALGSYGAYACCDKPMAKYLINCARTLIFSTALPPPAVAGALAALEMLRESPALVDKLQRNARVHARGAGRRGRSRCRPSRETQIIPLVVGDAARDDGRLRARARRGRLRAGHPPADRARRARRGCGWR